MKKRIMALLLAMTLSLSITACENMASNKDDSDSSDVKTESREADAEEKTSEEEQPVPIQFGATVALKDIQACLKQNAHGTIVAMKTKNKDEFYILQGPTEDTSGIRCISADRPGKYEYPDPLTGYYEYSSLIYPASQQVEFNLDRHELVIFSENWQEMLLSIYELRNAECPYVLPFLLSKKEPGSIYYGDRNPYVSDDDRSPKALFDACLLMTNQSFISANNGSLISLGDLTVNGAPVEFLEDYYEAAYDESSYGYDTLDYFYLRLPSDSPYVMVGGTYNGSPFEATFSPAVMVMYDDDFERVAGMCGDGVCEDGYVTCDLDSARSELLRVFSKNNIGRVAIGNVILYFTAD